MNEVRTMRHRAGMTQADLAAASGVPQPNIAAYESDSRRPSATTLERIRAAAKPRPSQVLAEHREQVRRLVGRHKGTRARVFGSVARGEDRSGSDLDLIVTFEESASLFDLVELQQDLEDLLGTEVDIISEGGLRPGWERVTAEAQVL